MKTNICILFTLILVFGCTKDNTETDENIVLKPYIRNLISADTINPFIGDYYIHVNFKEAGTSQSKELTFSEREQTMGIWYYPVDVGFGMSIQGVIFSDPKTSKRLQITFYSNSAIDTTFKICFANYYFADPWRKVAGTNVEYSEPIDISNPSTLYLYLGTNSTENFFKLTYIGNNRLNGTFQTIWKECCGGLKTFDVSGDFSIPAIQYYK